MLTTPIRKKEDIDAMKKYFLDKKIIGIMHYL